MNRSLFFAGPIIVCLLVAGSISSASSQTVTLKVGPGLFEDSLWNFTLFIPEGFLMQREANWISPLGHHGWIVSSTNELFQIGYDVTSFHRYFSHFLPEDRPKLTADPDTVKQMVSALSHVGLSYTTSASNITRTVDSIAEAQTESGLRVFVVHETMHAGYRHGGDTTTTLAPYYYVAVPTTGDCIFVSFACPDDHPSEATLELAQRLARSVAAWKK